MSLQAIARSDRCRPALQSAIRSAEPCAPPPDRRCRWLDLVAADRIVARRSPSDCTATPRHLTRRHGRSTATVAVPNSNGLRTMVVPADQLGTRRRPAPPTPGPGRRPRRRPVIRRPADRGRTATVVAAFRFSSVPLCLCGSKLFFCNDCQITAARRGLGN